MPCSGYVRGVQGKIDCIFSHPSARWGPVLEISHEEYCVYNIKRELDVSLLLELGVRYICEGRLDPSVRWGDEASASSERRGQSEQSHSVRTTCLPNFETV